MANGDFECTTVAWIPTMTPSATSVPNVSELISVLQEQTYSFLVAIGVKDRFFVVLLWEIDDNLTNNLHLFGGRAMHTHVITQK